MTTYKTGRTERKVDGERYSEETPDRWWVVRSSYKPTPSGRTLHSWWYGPDHGWGTTFGTLDYSVATFPTAGIARAAIQRGYNGAPSGRLTPQRVDDARRLLAEQREGVAS